MAETTSMDLLSLATADVRLARWDRHASPRPYVGAIGVLVAAGFGAASSASVKVVDAHESSPWWQGRLVNFASPIDESPAAGSREISFAPSESEELSDLLQIRPADQPEAMTRRRISSYPHEGLRVDLGMGAISAVVTGLMLGAEPAGLRRVSSEGLATLDTVADGDSLVADPAQVLAAAASPIDDAEWDEADDGPRWLALESIDYRGGGIMSRREGGGAE